MQNSKFTVYEHVKNLIELFESGPKKTVSIKTYLLMKPAEGINK
jgi:hypothetical protein